MKNLKYIFFSFLLLGLWSCNEVEDVLEDNGVSTPEDLPALTAGSADFSNYVAEQLKAILERNREAVTELKSEFSH